MNDEVELISDGEGLAVIGEPGAIERFMASSGLAKIADSPSTGATINVAAATTQAASEIAANSGRWLKVTKESAEKIRQFGLIETDTPGVSHAMVGKPGEIKNWIQVVKGPGALAANPAVLAGAAGVMAQLAMKQQMDAITDYLAVIDEKLDDVLRAQTNQVLAQMDGVDLAVQEAMRVKESVGRVSEVSWSKVQHQSSTVLETQAYALRQLGDLTEKLERKKKVGDLADTAKEAEAEAKKWLLVLARCVQLHDAIGILELDRVLDASPDELDRHRVGLQTARSDRMELLSQKTSELVQRMDAAVSTANAKVLLHPITTPVVVRSRNNVASEVHGFQTLLGTETGSESFEARRWKEAAAERLDAARTTGAHGVEAVKRAGGEARDEARSVGGKLAGKIGGRLPRRDGSGKGEQTEQE